MITIITIIIITIIVIIGVTIKGTQYKTESKFRKYVKGYGFLSFARKFGDKYGKKLMDTATKTGIDAAKTASKRVVQKARRNIHSTRKKTTNY